MKNRCTKCNRRKKKEFFFGNTLFKCEFCSEKFYFIITFPLIITLIVGSLYVAQTSITSSYIFVPASFMALVWYFRFKWHKYFFVYYLVKLSWITKKTQRTI